MNIEAKPPCNARTRARWIPRMRCALRQVSVVTVVVLGSVGVVATSGCPGDSTAADTEFCGDTYAGPTADTQSSVFCQQAYALRCEGRDQDADDACRFYQQFEQENPSLPSCPYCGGGQGGNGDEVTGGACFFFGGNGVIDCRQQPSQSACPAANSPRNGRFFDGQTCDDITCVIEGDPADVATTVTCE